MSRTAQNCEEGGFYADLVKKGQAFFCLAEYRKEAIVTEPPATSPQTVPSRSAEADRVSAPRCESVDNAEPVGLGFGQIPAHDLIGKLLRELSFFGDLSDHFQRFNDFNLTGF
jgi:hypothetical protein